MEAKLEIKDEIDISVLSQMELDELFLKGKDEVDKITKHLFKSTTPFNYDAKTRVLTFGGIKISDMMMEADCTMDYTADYTVVLDIGGKAREKVWASTLKSSAYFRNMLGVYGKGADKQLDGSYFIDCDPESFQFILDVLRVGIISKLPKLTQAYMDAVFAKFDIPQIEKIVDTEIIIQNDIVSACNKLLNQETTKLNEIQIHFIASPGGRKFKIDADEKNALVVVYLNRERYQKSIKPLFQDIYIQTASKTTTYTAGVLLFKYFDKVLPKEKKFIKICTPANTPRCDVMPIVRIGTVSPDQIDDVDDVDDDDE